MAHDKPKIGEISVTLGNNNRVGDIGHKIFQAPPPRRLTEEIKGQFRANLPNKERKIAIHYVSSESDAAPLAKEIYDFLLQEGFSTEGPSLVLFTEHQSGLKLLLNANPIMIIVGNR